MDLNNTLLQINNLKVDIVNRNGRRNVVNGVNLAIHRHETFALVGESGGGKTLTSLAIMQLLPSAMHVQPGSSIYFERQDLLQLSEIAMRNIRGRRIGMIFQEPMTALNPVLTIGEQIGEVLNVHLGLRGKARQTQAQELLSAVGITDPKQCYQQYPHQLSGGMQQRAMIAIAIAARPDLLIADEPTSALDVTIQAQILELLKRLQQQTGMAILLITHDLGVVKQFADRVAIINAGQIIEQASVKEFFTAPQHAYSQKLLKAAALPVKFNQEITPGKDAPEAILQVANLQVYFPIQKGILKRTTGWIKAVDGISFCVGKGKTVAVVGESGSGKTTAAKSILQLIKPTAGSIKFCGRELTGLSGAALRQVRQDLQIIFQDPYTAMNPRMMVGDIIAEGMMYLGLVKSTQEKERRVDILLEQVNLPAESKYRYPHEFSGGQRQRICIARALAVRPKLLVCDEPTSALDVSIQIQILNLLKALQAELALSYLFITHNLAVVAYLADEVAVMYQGRIVEYDTAENILTAPKHPYTQTLLAAAPQLTAFC